VSQQYVDDKAIADADLLWRRILRSQIVLDQNTGRQRPSSAAFEDSPDGTPMSAFWEKLHRELGHNEADALRGHEDLGLASFAVKVARELGQGIQRDPLPEAPAHVLVFGPKPKKSVSRKLAAAAELIVMPPERTP
jgi:hypothetical protein